MRPTPTGLGRESGVIRLVALTPTATDEGAAMTGRREVPVTGEGGVVMRGWSF
jgi:hypothetical protein